MIKRILLAALFAPILAHADVIATTHNVAGGQIFLTNTQDDCPKKAHSYTSMSFGDERIDDYGCWLVIAPRDIVWKSSLSGQIGHWFYDSENWKFYAGAFSN